jgi:hypothetical protein
MHASQWDCTAHARGFAFVVAASRVNILIYMYVTWRKCEERIADGGSAPPDSMLSHGGCVPSYTH